MVRTNESTHTHKIDADKNSCAFIVLLWGVATVIALLIRIQTHGFKKNENERQETSAQNKHEFVAFTSDVVKWNNGYISE